MFQNVSQDSFSKHGHTFDNVSKNSNPALLEINIFEIKVMTS